MALSASQLKIGDSHGETVVENLTRTQIVQYAGASGDYNPIHTDEIYTTRAAGYPSVFAHGMLTMGLTGKMLTNYVGDGNNVARSWIEAAVRFGFTLRLATPEALRPPADLVTWALAQGGRIELTDDPDVAVAGARCVVTDTWVSMSDDPNESRHNLLAPYRVSSRLMAKAAPDAIFMHCLPAHRGEEVTDEVIDGPQSVVFDEAENRLHAQKGVLAWVLGAVR